MMIILIIVNYILMILKIYGQIVSYCDVLDVKSIKYFISFL